MKTSWCTGLKDPVFDSQQKQKLSSVKCPHQLWGQSSLLFNGYQVLFPKA
jgi:hypothetical protein